MQKYNSVLFLDQTLKQGLINKQYLRVDVIYYDQMYIWLVRLKNEYLVDIEPRRYNKRSYLFDAITISVNLCQFVENPTKSHHLAPSKKAKDIFYDAFFLSIMSSYVYFCLFFGGAEWCFLFLLSYIFCWISFFE